MRTGVFSAAILCMACFPAGAKDRFGNPELKVPGNPHKLTVALADAELWNGKQVPKDMQCARLGGKNPTSPALLISALPDKVKSLVVFYANPRSMDNHGLVRVTDGRDGANWSVPAIKSSAPAEELPKGVEMYDGGNMIGKPYSSPCPQGGRWSYTIKVYALDETDTVIGVGEQGMGFAP